MPISHLPFAVNAILNLSNTFLSYMYVDLSTKVSLRYNICSTSISGQLKVLSVGRPAVNTLPTTKFNLKFFITSKYVNRVILLTRGVSICQQLRSELACSSLGH